MIAVALVALVAVCAGAAVARPRPSVKLGLTSARAGAPARIGVRASLGAAVSGTLMSYELDLARGFRFDSRAAPLLCAGRALGSDTCPLLSRVGSGTGRIAVQGRFLPRTEYAVSASLYLSPPRRPGDLAAVLLDLDQAQSSLQVALLGSVERIRRGAYGLALRFADTARELPAVYHLTLADLDFGLGATSSATGSVHSLFTNPRKCQRGGWPVSMAIRSGHVRRAFTTRARCR